mmetsp:Transcript_10445/g.19082  ORF Transcript_10445/g.19082 Transcript_10445/m.19082 type:complete len:237 (+) Transcript_10445:281-991(+)
MKSFSPFTSHSLESKFYSFSFFDHICNASYQHPPQSPSHHHLYHNHKDDVNDDVEDAAEVVATYRSCSSVDTKREKRNDRSTKSQQRKRTLLMSTHTHQQSRPRGRIMVENFLASPCSTSAASPKSVASADSGSSCSSQSTCDETATTCEETRCSTSTTTTSNSSHRSSSSSFSFSIHEDDHYDDDDDDHQQTMPNCSAPSSILRTRRQDSKGSCGEGSSNHSNSSSVHLERNSGV